MAERYRIFGTKQWEKDGRVESILRHESGHEVDSLLRPTGRCSDSSEFKAAYADDVAKMPDDDKPGLNYYLQSEGGRSETFAEVFAAIIGGGSEPNKRLIAKDFSRTRAVVQKMIDELK